MTVLIAGLIVRSASSFAGLASVLGSDIRCLMMLSAVFGRGATHHTKLCEGLKKSSLVLSSSKATTFVMPALRTRPGLAAPVPRRCLKVTETCSLTTAPAPTRLDTLWRCVTLRVKRCLDSSAVRGRCCSLQGVTRQDNSSKFSLRSTDKSNVSHCICRMTHAWCGRHKLLQAVAAFAEIGMCYLQLVSCSLSLKCCYCCLLACVLY
eukprot:GHRR01026194.1.p1 GENE.GHRR01026194.1~~GHRR01026194.1.p1  ORF type:complete len:207 (-),score=31.78 GHRR01026194.1:446-1066(-)